MEIILSRGEHIHTQEVVPRFVHPWMLPMSANSCGTNGTTQKFLSASINLDFQSRKFSLFMVDDRTYDEEDAVPSTLVEGR